MKYVNVTKDSTKDGARQYQFSLPNSVRTLYAHDPIHCEDWRKLIMDFDSKLLA